MMNTRLIYHTVLILSITLQAYCVVFNKEIYPFSLFPMYRGKLSELDFFQCTVMVKIKDSNKLIPYRKVGRTSVQYYFQHDLCEDLDKAIILKKDINKLKSISDEYFKGIRRSNKNSIKKMVFIGNFWKKINYENLNNPDKKIIIYERNF